MLSFRYRHMHSNNDEYKHQPVLSAKGEVHYMMSGVNVLTRQTEILYTRWYHQGRFKVLGCNFQAEQ